MARRLTPSPLPARIPAPEPIRTWIWHEAGAYDGLFLPGATVPPEGVLALLDPATRVLQAGGGLCILFGASREIDPTTIGPALALRRNGRGFASYPCPEPGAPGALDLVLNGAPVTLDLSQATEIDPLSFWDVSGLELVAAQPLPPQVANPWQQAGQDVLRVRTQDLGDLAPDEVFANVARAIDAQPDRRTGDLARQIGVIGLRLGATAMVLLLTLIVIMAALSIFALGAAGGPFGALIGIAAALWLLMRFFAPRGRAVNTGRASGRASGRGSWTGKGGRAGVGQAAGRPREPGVFQSLLGWAIWNTPAGDGFRRKLQRHMDEVQKLIANGEIDRALKNAISLAQDAENRNKRARPMSRLPKARASLDLNFSGLDRPTSSILTTAGLGGLAQQYRELAAKLRSEGDFPRAAFIYAELLNEITAAIATLEEGELFEEAAKLATARKQSGYDIARLWYRAGQFDIALMFARRHGAMEMIANQAAAKHPEFAALVRRHWVEDLIAAGDLTKALSASEGHPELARIHKAVVQQAVLAGLLDDPKVLWRATCLLDWSTELLSATAPPSGATARDLLEAELHGILTSDSAGSAREALMWRLSGTEDAKDELGPARGPALADALIRSVLLRDAESDLKTLREVAATYGLATLAEDLRQVSRNAPRNPKSSWQVALSPRDRVRDLPWLAAACVQRGQSLLASPEGALSLISRSGERLWTDHMSELQGIVPVGPGRLVILVCGTQIRRRLILLDVALHRYRDLGQLDLLAWDRLASAEGWLVQTGDAVCNLNLPLLLGEETVVETVWSIAQTVPVQVLSFAQHHDEFEWISQRIEKTGQPGMMERWSLYKRGFQLHVTIIDPSDEATRRLYVTPFLMESKSMAKPFDIAAAQSGDAIRYRHVISSYDFEQKTLKNAGTFLGQLKRPARVIAGRTARANSDSAAGVDCIEIDAARAVALLKGAAMVDLAVSNDGRHMVILDDRGRAIGIDCTARTSWTLG